MKKLVLLSLLLFSILVQSQEAKTIVLSDAINYALKNKVEAKKAALDIENTKNKISQARSKFLPQIAAAGGLTYNPSLQKSIMDGALFGGPPGSVIEAEFGQKWTSFTGIMFSQKLYDQSAFIGLKAMRTTKEFYQLNKELTDNQIIERVANVYIQIYITKQMLKTTTVNLENSKKAKNIIEGLVNSGLAKKIDLDGMEVRIANIQTGKQNIENAILVQENVLKFYMGMPINTNIILAELDTTIHTFDNNDIDVTNRKEFTLLKKQEQLLNYQLKSVKASYFPTLTLSGNFNYLGQGSKIPWFKKPSDGVYWSSFSAVNLNLSVPIFTGFAIKSGVNQLKIGVKQFQLDIEDTKLALELEGVNAKKQIENSLIIIKTQEKNKELADKILKNTKNNYQQGLATLTEVIEAEDALYEAQNNYTTALLNFQLAKIQLLKSKGELKTLK